MGKIALQLKATLENVTNLRPVGEDFRWYLKMKCGNCGEISDKWQYIRLMDSVALKGGRGSASMVQKCKLCARENSIEILSSTIKSYNAEDNEKFKTVVEFECRGLEPVDFQPQDSKWGNTLVPGQLPGSRSSAVIAEQLPTLHLCPPFPKV
ncbi:CXXC motif containing zinc binding protein isoform X1 [Rhinolophus sinicus]|uniref:CXXC motif containing zinc binding protein isoform X1 n=1 Tax=Rhinolophus sinicus TaxID=89399 RepID=UPI003D79B690